MPAGILPSYLCSSFNPSFLHFSPFFVQPFLPLFFSFLHSIIPSLPSLLSLFNYYYPSSLRFTISSPPSFPPSLLRNYLPFFLLLFIRSIFLPFSFLSRRRIRRHCYSPFYKRLRCARNFLLFEKYLVTALIFFKKRKIWN